MWKQKAVNLTAFIITFSISMVGTGTAHGQEWKQYETPAAAGWSADKLETARKFATGSGSAAVFIVEKGNVVAAWGDVDHPFKAASIRKSIYDVTFGAVDKTKKFDLSKTVGELGLDDIESLTDSEKKATVEQLMEARSGIYHAAAYETRSNADRRPERGSHAPGEFWYYNNWDFNVVTASFRKMTGSEIDTVFEKEIVNPLGLEDYRSDHVFRWLEPRDSIYPAVTYRISARDLARIGQLYLNKGQWQGKEIVSKEWIRESTRPHTVFEEDSYRGEGNGYGRLWWIWPADKDSESRFQRYHRIAARGAGGQVMILFPEIDLVIVHLADTDAGNGIADSVGADLMEKILEARVNGAGAGAKTGPVRVQPLSEKKPAPLKSLKTIPQSLVGQIAGKFMVNDAIGMEFYIYEGRLFASPVGMRLPDAEMLLDRDGTLTSPLAAVVFEPVAGPEGKISEMKMTFAGRTSVAKRVR